MNWDRETEDRITSAEGYVITRHKAARGYWYNAWIPLAIGGRCIEAGWGQDALANCKSACERHWIEVAAQATMCRDRLLASQPDAQQVPA